jgi:probable F420-dependent oxidoreductase
MKFGVMAPYAVGRVEDADYAVEFARLAERSGFESIWTVEHVLMNLEYESVYPYDPSGRTPFTPQVAQPDPLIWLAYVAAATETIRLATGVLNLPQRNPLILAKEIATLDRLSRGRMELGIGVGWVREEAEILGTCWQDRGKRANEYIEVMRALWSEGEASTYSGEYFTFNDVVSMPKPVQDGGVPIVVGGHSRAAARRAGRYGDGFFPLGAMGAELTALLDVVRAEADRAARDAGAIELTLIGTPDLRAAEALAGQGADRMIIAALQGDLSDLALTFERFRSGVIERM